MNLQPSKTNRTGAAFSLIELLISSTIGLVITGSVMMLFFYSSREQVRGVSSATVEQTAYVLQNNIINTLRTMSADNAMTPDTSMSYYDTNGNLLGYQGIATCSKLTNGSLQISKIYFDTTSNQVVYIPDMSNTNNKVYWATNSTYCTVRNLYFLGSVDLDGTMNNRLVNVFLQLDDNGYSTNNFYGVNATNNSAGIFRTFSVLMKAS